MKRARIVHPFALSEVEGSCRTEGEAFSLRSNGGFDKLSPNGREKGC